jgi:hypothetical protein
MSGGGGGTSDWRPAGGQIGGDSGDDGCDIVERTVLNSPVADVVKVLLVGSILSVVFVEGPPTRLVALDSDGRTAGAITSPRLVDLIECIQAGNTYVATVIALDGGRIEVEIRRK